MPLLVIIRQGKNPEKVDFKLGREFLYINCKIWYAWVFSYAKSNAGWCQSEKSSESIQNGVKSKMATIGRHFEVFLFIFRADTTLHLIQRTKILLYTKFHNLYTKTPTPIQFWNLSLVYIAVVEQYQCHSLHIISQFIYKISQPNSISKFTLCLLCILPSLCEDNLIWNYQNLPYISNNITMV